MEQCRRYTVDGFELVVPLYRDEFSGRWLEDYSQWFELDRFTPHGHLILCSSEEACEYAEGVSSERCVECAACRYYERADEHTWIGICKNKNKNIKSGGI